VRVKISNPSRLAAAEIGSMLLKSWVAPLPAAPLLRVFIFLVARKAFVIGVK
jgi:hypothetical protein